MAVNSETIALVEVGLSMPITLAVDQPATLATPASFALWGFIGAAQPAHEVFAGIGTLCFTPYHLDPSFPGAFTVANSFMPDPSALAPATPAPWSVTHPGLPFPLTVTVQGVVEVSGGPTNTLGLTNGIVIDVD